MRTPLERAREFLRTHARLVERRVFEHAFEGGSADAVVQAVRAYRNADGGLGHALEPDLRTPASQPVFVDYGLTVLAECGANDLELVASACAFLAGVARPDGAIPYILPDSQQSPRAGHWNGDYGLKPSLLATAGLAARLHALARSPRERSSSRPGPNRAHSRARIRAVGGDTTGPGARHEWLDRATAWCFEQIAGRPDYSGHRILNVMEFLTHAPDRGRATALWPHVTSRLFEADYVTMDTPVTSYGLTPLRFAPRPDAPARTLFADDVIERHLGHLAEQQRDDGGWPIFWEPPGGAAVAEWRGRWTLEALLVLRAYDRLE